MWMDINNKPDGLFRDGIPPLAITISFKATIVLKRCFCGSKNQYSGGAESNELPAERRDYRHFEQECFFQ